MNRFLAEVGWTPSCSATVAGARQYTHYDWMRKMVMKAIARSEHYPTDSGQEYKYTDWEALRSFVDDFVDRFVKDVGQVPELTQNLILSS